jgi:hypothetical protein
MVTNLHQLFLEAEAARHKMIAANEEVLAAIQEMRRQYGDELAAKTIIQENLADALPHGWLMLKAQRKFSDALVKAGWKIP